MALQLIFLQITILIGFADLAVAAEDFRPPPGQRPALTDTQRDCLEKSIGKRDGSGSPPAPSEGMTAAFEKCGIKPPGGHPPEVRSSKDSPQIPKAEEMITDFKSYKGAANDYVRLGGFIPKKCAGSFNLSFICEAAENKLSFQFAETSSDGLKCLKENKKLCEGQDKSECTSLDEIAKARTSNFLNRLVTQNTKDKSCKDLEISSISVGTSFKVFQTSTVTKKMEKTEGGICEACEAAKNSQVDKMKSFASELELKVKDQQNPRAMVAAQSSEDADAMKRHLQREKDRIIKKIKSSPCKKPGDDDDDDFDPSDVMSMAGDREMPGGRKGPGGPPGGFGGGPGGIGPEGGDMKKMFAGNLEFQDDIQDAMDAKMESCQKQAQRQKKKMPGGGMQANGMNGGMTGGMGGQQSMGGMSSMFGNMGMMGGGMGGQQSMGGMSSMFGNMGMMGGGMGGSTSNPYLGSYGMSSMMLWSPFMTSNYGMSGSSYYPSAYSSYPRSYGYNYSPYSYGLKTSTYPSYSQSYNYPYKAPYYGISSSGR